MTTDDRAVLDEQIDYYRARADEYDEWFHRQGRYDRGPAATAAWFHELDRARAALDALPLDHTDIVELAPGTGLWTQHLVARARHVTVIDAAPEMLELCRRRLADIPTHVDYVCADLFDWAPTRTWDTVVFCFWISHIPAARLDPFLDVVRRALRPGGRLFFIDNRQEPTSTAGNHTLPGLGEPTAERHLNDGRRFTIIKHYWTADDLTARFARAGLDVAITETATYFQFGTGKHS